MNPNEIRNQRLKSGSNKAIRKKVMLGFASLTPTYVYSKMFWHLFVGWASPTNTASLAVRRWRCPHFEIGSSYSRRGARESFAPVRWHECPVDIHDNSAAPPASGEGNDFKIWMPAFQT